MIPRSKQLSSEARQQGIERTELELSGELCADSGLDVLS